MEILGAGIFVLTLLGWSFIAQKIFYTNAQGSLFIGIQLLILGLYTTAILDILPIGVYFLEGIGVIALLYQFYSQNISTKLLTPIKKSYYLIPFLAFTVTIPEDFKFTMSDEFPSWAANVKTMFAENGLAGINSATRTIADGFYQSYPPFQQLFQYLFLKNTSWSESNVQIAQNILTLSILLGAVALILESYPSLIFPAWISAIVLYFLFGFTMSNLLADGLLAIQFAACLGLAISMRENFRHYLLLGLLIGNLVLIKPTGFVLATCAIIFSIVILFSTSIPESNLFQRKVPIFLTSKLLRLSVLMSLPAITYLSWQFHLRLIQMNPGVDEISFSNLSANETLTRWSKTWSAYKDNFFGSLYGADNLAGISSSAPTIVRVFNISLFMIFASLAIMQIVLAIANRNVDRKIAIKLTLVITLLAVLYQLFLLVLYMFFFGEYEGTRSAGLVRYSASFFLGWTIFVFTQLLKTLSAYKYSKIANLSLVSTLILVAPSSFASEVTGNYTDLTKLPARIDVEKMASETIKIVPEDKKVYYLYQGSNGYEKYIFSYLVLPRRTNWTCPSLGAPLYEGDVWTCELELAQAITGYDYLVVGKGDVRFWDENSRYLAQGSLPTPRGVFQIVTIGKSLRLVQVN